MSPERGAGMRAGDLSNLFCMPVRQLGAVLREGSLSAHELLDHYLERIRRLNPHLNAFVYVDFDGASEAASASDARLRAGQALSALDGIPVAIKDNLLMRHCPAAWGSPLYAGYIPDHDELPVAKLRSRGAILLGKTNVPEFAMRGFTGNPVYGVTRNPWNLALTPGGSSGGAVAAVAAGLAPLALATDGGGSIRRPAAYTNLVGLKPSIGRVLRGNGFPQLMLDCEVVGPIAQRADDARLLFDAIAEPATMPAGRRAPPRYPRILYADKFGAAPVDPEILRVCSAAADRFVQLGYSVHRAGLPFPIEAAVSAWQNVTNAGFAALARRHPAFSGTASADFVMQAEAGERLSSLEYRDAVGCLSDFRAALARAFDGMDLIMTPAAAAQPWPAEEAFPPVIAGCEVGPRGHAVFTPWVNACGHPAIALPAGFDEENRPVGFQLIAPNGCDEWLLDIAQEYETAFARSHVWPDFAVA